MKVFKVIIRLLVASLLIFIGLSLYNVFYPLTLQYVIENKIMMLQPNSKFYQAWSDTKEPMRTEIYLFELVNARDFLRGKKPQVVEHGPFVFNHYKKRVNISWSKDGKKMSFYESSIFYFDRSQSVAGLHDYNITVINLALMTTMNTLWKQTQSGLLNILSPAVTTFTKQILTSNSEYITERRTPGQLLVGRRAYFMDRIQRYLSLANSLGISVEKSPVTEMKRVGYFQFTNNTLAGPIVINTGKRTFAEFVEEFVHHNRDNQWVRFYGHLFGFDSLETEESQSEEELERIDQQLDRGVMKIESFENKKYYGKYLRPNCNEIKGTDGTLQNDYFVRKHKDLYLYSDLCRPLKMVFESKKYFTLINYANQYVLDNDTFASKRERWCFCPGVSVVRQRAPTDRRTCTRSRKSGNVICRMVSPKNATVLYKVTGDLQKCDGYHDMATCNEYLPIAITFPHFLNSPRLQRAVDGLSPDYDQHRSYINIEPHFGVTMEAQVKLQVNVKVHPAASIENFDKFKPTIMPYLWMVEMGTIGQDTERTLLIVLACFYLGYGLCALVSIWGVLVIVLLLFSARQRKGAKNEFLDIDNFKKRHSVRFETDASIWNSKEVLKSQLRKSKKLIERKSNSSNSLNQILPSHMYPNLDSEDDHRFEKRKSISLKEERVHSNRTQRSQHSNRSIAPLD